MNAQTCLSPAPISSPGGVSLFSGEVWLAKVSLMSDNVTLPVFLSCGEAYVATVPRTSNNDTRPIETIRWSGWAVPSQTLSSQAEVSTTKVRRGRSAD